MAKRVKKSQAGSESDPPGEGNTGSPIFDDFDEELCMELEEVGKELDRYEAESLRVSDSDQVECPLEMQRVTSSPPLQCLPQGTPQATQLTSMSAVLPRRDEGEAVSAESCEAAPVSSVSPEVKEGSEEESECQLKALSSLKASLVTKLKMMVTHKTNLASHKDSLLKNFDGDKSKLGENLQKHLSQCKGVDVQIQNLNAQISLTKKKIIGIKSKKHLLDTRSHKNQSAGSSVHEKPLIQNQSGAVKDSPVKTDDVCGSSYSSSTEDTVRTQTEKTEDKERERVDTESSCESQNSKQIDARPGTGHSKPHLHSKPCNTSDSLPVPAEAQEAKKSECLVVEKVASTLAMHPSSKNVNTLWCNTCNLFLTSITGYIKHLELPEHLNKEQEDEHCLYKLLGRPKKPHKKVRSKTQEALGVEFLRSTKLIYCSLCECPLVTREEATTHSQSLQHTIKYKEYILKNTSKELAFQKAKMEAFTEYCKKRKATGKDKHKPEGKDEDSHRKTIPKVDENKTKGEAGLRRTELLKVKTPSEKGAWSESENDSCGLQGKAKESRKLIKESPLMPQRTNVNIQTAKSVVGGSIKRPLESTPMNKRQKIIN